MSRTVLGAAQIVVGVVSLALVAGCDVDPYCVSCGDDVDAGDAGRTIPDASRGDVVFVPDTGPVDSGLPDGCTEGFEACNDRDDDCDGMVDEGIDITRDVENCGGCGMFCGPPHAFPACIDSTCTLVECDVGWHDLDGDLENGCEYRCTASDTMDALCDLRDNDCDGTVDEDVAFMTDPMNCGTCGRVCSFAHSTASCMGGSCLLGSCETGYYDLDGVATNGCEYMCTPTATTETDALHCNLRDDDCDGMIDEGDPGGGAACGMETGECAAGTTACIGGSVQCSGGVGPTTELCNGLDDDCDGTADEGDPEGGRLCGSRTGTCSQGRERCTSGSLVCMGAVGPVMETCDGLDNDCDGTIDDGNPGGGASCGVDTGACSFGTVMCSAGSLMCVGGVGPAIETCNAMDDDCDGMTDEIFDLTSDPRHCGMCGRVCSFPNATGVCASSTCAIGACDPGFVDLDGMITNGCEYMCSPRGAEVCNGLDDDCDGMTDELLTPPATFCNPNGVCMGTIPTCGGSMGWQCMYPSTYEESETRCDGVDNDCDGSVDEPFPLAGNACTNGALGSCLRMGTYVCNATNDGVLCNAPAPPTPGTETCNGQDDDCDGVVDDGMTPTIIPTVSIPRAGGGTVQMMRYEASRPDATTAAAGTLSTHACGTANRVPWTTVTWTEARDACCALNPSGTCGATGWRLCDAPDWETACEGPAGTCDWSYATMCTASQRTVCNGKEYDCNSATPQDEDCLFTTGSATFPSCRTPWTTASIYDLSGNAREWTNTSRGTAIYELRGGSFNNVEAGRACDFDFTVAEQTFRHPNTGFRCCYY